MTTNPTPPASPDRIAEAIAKLGGHEKARKIIAAVRELDGVRSWWIQRHNGYLGTVALLSQIDNQLRNLRTPQPTPAAEEPAAAAPDADSEEVVEQGPSTPTSPERPQGRQLLAQFLDWMNAEFPIDPNYDRFAAIRAGARELLDLTPGTLGQPDANDEGRFSMIQCQFDSVDWIPKATEAIDNLDTRLRAVERELARKGAK